MSFRVRKFTDGERGFIINLTVWISVLLLMSSLLTSIVSRTNSSTLKNNSDLLQAQEIAMGGFHVATSLLGDADFLKMALEQGNITKIKISNANVEIKFEDERGKVDLNTFPVEIIREMFVSIGAQHGVDAFNAVGIAERLSKLPTSKNGDRAEKIRSISDLQFIEGVTLDFYKAVEPYITVHGLDRKINPMTASKQVLNHIPGINYSDIQKLFSARLNQKPRPSLGSAESWFTSLTGPIYKIVVSVKLPNEISHTLTALVVLSEEEFDITGETVKIIEIH